MLVILRCLRWGNEPDESAFVEALRLLGEGVVLRCHAGSYA